MARPAKLTPETQQRIVTAIAAGNTRDVAAAYAGVHPAQLFRWLKLGRAGKNGYVAFAEAVAKADADAVVLAVGTIRTAMHDSWQAAAWWLERRYPDEWGRKDRVEIERVIRREAERLAEETGLNVDEIVAAAEAIAASG